MIEIIREEDFEQTDRKELPKDIKQIGKPDIGERIYVENQTYEYLHPYDNPSEKNAYILLGRFENYAGRQCIFVEAAIHLEEMAFDGELPIWNDQTWGYIYRQMKSEYDNMVIVGWAMDIKGQLPNLTMRIEALHQNHFGGAHQILFLIDSLEREEAFYGSRNGHLYRRDGFYVYYDKAIPGKMNHAMEELKQEQPGNEEPLLDTMIKEPESFHQEEPVVKHIKPRQGSYRQQLLEREEKQQAPSYASSFLLLVVVCAIGITAYINYQKMNAMEEALAHMNETQRTETLMKETETEEILKIEKVEGNVAAQTTEQPAASQPGLSGTGQNGTELTGNGVNVNTENSNAEQMNGQAVAQQGAETTPETVTQQGAETTPETVTQQGAETTPETVETTTPVLTEAQTYLAQGYYVVQKGDSLVGICKKIYQTTAMMDKVCEANGIEDENQIYAGQRLILPN